MSLESPTRISVGLVLTASPKSLNRYIYDPIASSTRAIIGRYIATLVCFMCVVLWHLPMTPTLIIWIGLNIVGSFIELWAKALGRTPFWSNVQSRLSRPNLLRLVAFASLPLFLLAIISNTYFLSNNELIGQEFIRRVLSSSNRYFIYLMIVLYCGANVSLDYNRTIASSIDLAKMHGLRRS